MDTQESVSSVEPTPSAASGTMAARKKKRKQSDFSTVLTGAVESIDKLSCSILASQKSEKPDFTMDDDWLFARRVFLKLKNIPCGQEKERFKYRMEGELLNLAYNYQATGQGFPTTSDVINSPPTKQI